MILTGANFYLDDKFVTSLTTLAVFLTINLVFLFVADIIAKKTGKWIVKIIAEMFAITFLLAFVWLLITKMGNSVGGY